MTENANHSADDAAEQKGRAEEEQTQPETTATSDISETNDTTEVGESKKDKSEDETKEEVSSNSSGDTEEKSEEEKQTAEEQDPEESKKEAAPEESDKEKSTSTEKSTKQATEASVNKDNAEFQKEIREQIDNCKFEIISSLQDSVHTELQEVTEKQIRRVERRRRAGFIIRDILILILAAIVGYFGYCLYDVKYFDFMRPNCTEQNSCETSVTPDEPVTEPEEVKDLAWYQRRYGELFQSLQTNLNADEVSAYYLYSDDYKVSEIQPKYLLAMAYNRLNSNVTYDGAGGIAVPASDLRVAFIELFGDAEYFSKQNFTYDCTDFKYNKDTDSFTADSVLCAHNSNRKIVESIDEIYEEGNAMYFLTTAAIFDQAEQSFYSFDNLFKPVAKNVTSEDITKHSSLLNHYQYQFKKVDEKYYFSGIVKLN